MMRLPGLARSRIAAVVLLCAAGTPDSGAYELSRVTLSSTAPAGASGGLTLVGSTLSEAGLAGRTGGSGLDLGLGFWTGYFQAGGLTGVEPGTPLEVAPRANQLGQNSPNPFRGTTSISYALRAPAPVRLVIYDVTGRRVSTLVDGPSDAGAFTVRWDGSDERGATVASGIYYYRIDSGAWSATRRMLKLR